MPQIDDENIADAMINAIEHNPFIIPTARVNFCHLIFIINFAFKQYNIMDQINTRDPNIIINDKDNVHIFINNGLNPIKQIPVIAQ